jgi:hypothetical protein
MEYLQNKIRTLEKDFNASCRFVNPPRGATLHDPKFDTLYKEWTCAKLIEECKSKHLSVYDKDNSRNKRKDELIHTLKRHHKDVCKYKRKVLDSWKRVLERQKAEHKKQQQQRSRMQKEDRSKDDTQQWMRQSAAFVQQLQRQLK